MKLAQENKPLTEKQRYWMNHITTAQSQNLSLSQYASEHSLPLKALYNWHWLLKSKGLLGAEMSPKPFVPVMREHQPNHIKPRNVDCTNLRLSFTNDTQIDIQIDTTDLGAVLAIVKAL